MPPTRGESGKSGKIPLYTEGFQEEKKNYLTDWRKGLKCFKERDSEEAQGTPNVHQEIGGFEGGDSENEEEAMLRGLCL